MHLTVPHAASLSEAGQQCLSNLRLPHLEKLLARLHAEAPIGTHEHSLNTPFEQHLAAQRGWQAPDGCLPFAAAAAQADGLQPTDDGAGWGLLTPSHWSLGRDQIQLFDPQSLALDAAQSQALLAAVRELFDSEGWALHWGAPLRWYAVHPSLVRLPTATLDRVIGRPIDAWLPARDSGRLVRRLQSEVQMLLYTHALNDEREGRGDLPVNSFWLSGTGRTQPMVGTDPTIDERLRGPCLNEDWAAWAEAWQALDAEVIAALAARAAQGESISLTLCGERHAQRFVSAEAGWWPRLAQRWRRVPAATVLAGL